VLGGSQGAVALNEALPNALAQPSIKGLYQIRHQAGRNNVDKTQEIYDRCSVDAEVSPFIDDMAKAYGWADLVVCRAGALTVSEIASAGVAALFIPYPHAVDDHQTKNAEYLVEQGAANVVQQSSLTELALAALLKKEFSDRSTLLSMAKAGRDVAMNNATKDVVNGCLEATCA